MLTALLSQYSVLFLNTYIMSDSFQYSKTAAAETPISPSSAILLLHNNLFSKLLPAPRSALPRERSFSLVQTDFQEQILMEKYDVSSFSDGGNTVGTDSRITDFTFLY